jgi:hypothetical protein
MVLLRHRLNCPQPSTTDDRVVAAGASRWRLLFLTALLLGVASTPAWSADTHATNTVIRELKKLSLEELMKVKVVTASKGKKERSAITFPAAASIVPLEEIPYADLSKLPEAPPLTSEFAVAGFTREAGVHRGAWPDWPAESRGG